MYKFCLTHKYNPQLENINYLNVGMGKNKFPESWMLDSTGDNISEKNKYYDMYSFHYWLWKNYLDKIKNNEWVCFSTYRRFWKSDIPFQESDHLKNKIIQTAPREWEGYNTILTEPTDLSQIKLSKLIKKGKKLLLKNPTLLFRPEKRNIKFHFDLMHHEGNLDKALDVIDKKEKNDFINYLNTNRSANVWNLFCCNSTDLLNNWYESVFTWLFKCEKIFGFENLKGYETGRLYAYLAERYLPYWFKKYSKTRNWPIYFYNTDDM
ncbi:DUF4422 domain-containing protein [Pelagibacteraceae bacterium]|jgi:hypothetical protein|nr:DUF4422 domain-containing protein [Pelagibacteraceae bacterium]